MNHPMSTGNLPSFRIERNGPGSCCGPQHVMVSVSDGRADDPTVIIGGTTDPDTFRAWAEAQIAVLTAAVRDDVPAMERVLQGRARPFHRLCKPLTALEMDRLHAQALVENRRRAAARARLWAVSDALEPPVADVDDDGYCDDCGERHCNCRAQAGALVEVG